MRSFTVVILQLQALVVHAQELHVNRNSDAQTSSMDKLADSLVDKLVNKLLGSQLYIPRRAPLFRSPHAASTARVQAAQVNLRSYGIGFNPLEKLALSAIDANNRGNRDLSLRALDESLSTLDAETKKSLGKVLDEVKAKESVLAGITEPTGFFDPSGFSTTATAGKLLFYREVELKHGRVAMLAALGILVGEKFHPLFEPAICNGCGDIDVPAYLAFQQTPLQNFWPAVVAAIAIPEIFSVFTFQNPIEGGGTWEMKKDHVPGDLGFDPLGLKPTDATMLKEIQTKELNNGRLAMIAAAGMIAQELATGQKLF